MINKDINSKRFRKRASFLTFGSPQIDDQEINEVVNSLKSGWIGTGPKVQQFESDFAAFKNIRATQVAAVNSCTAALHVSLIAAGIGPGDEVITTAMTFCATVNAIIHSGATPILADIDPLTFNIDPAEIRKQITKRTKAIVPVHFAGHPCDMDEIMSIAQEHGLKVIEDCAHTVEARYKDQNTGTIGDFGCFSFYVTKNITTGEGGMVIANSSNDIERVKRLALHGLSKDAWHRFSDAGYKHYQIVECGYKYNMMDIQAAIGIHQLRRVNESWLRRREIWESYQLEFKYLPIQTPAIASPEMRHAYHLYTILIDEANTGISRDTFLGTMTDLNIGLGVHYLSIPEHPYYQEKFGWRTKDYPNAKKVGRQTVSLPLSPKLTDADVKDVVNAVKYCLKNK